MVQIFACATALLSADFVDGFEPEALASKFIEVEKEYRVKFNKTKTSFNITGHWNAVQDAHKSLLQLKAHTKSKVKQGPSIEATRRNLNSLPEVQSQQSSSPCKNVDLHQSDIRLCDVNNSSSVWNSASQVKAGNPKRGRHATVNSSKTDQVPEPFVYIHFQDEAFDSETSVNMDKVLDEFEKGQSQSGNSVTKQDLKRILDKNTEQMGRPLQKHLARVSTYPNDTDKQGDASMNQNLQKTSGENVTERQFPLYHSQTDNHTRIKDQTQMSLSGSMDQTQHGAITVSDGQTSSVYISASEVSWPERSSNLMTSCQVNTVTGLVTTSSDNYEVSQLSQYDTHRSIENSSAEKKLYTAQALSSLNTYSEASEEIKDHIISVTQDKPLQDEPSYTDLDVGDRMQETNNTDLSETHGQLNMDTVQEIGYSLSVETSKVESEENIQAMVYTNTDNIESVANKDDGKKDRSSSEIGNGLADTCVSGESAVKTKKSTKKKAKAQSRKVERPKKTLLNDSHEEKDTKYEDENQESEVKDKNDDTKKTSEAIYKCTDCDYQGRYKKRLTEHMGRVHGLLTEHCRGIQEQTMFSCELCDKSFVFGKDLNRHKKIVHHANRYYCKLCNKLYKAKYVYDRHMSTHVEGYVQPMFKCQICVKEFTTKFSLGCHIKSEHLGLKKTYICPLCGKSFSQIRSYRQHANVHAGIRPYVCEICGKAFTYDKSLKEHRYMHDNIRRFPCTICNKAFRQRTCLLIHMKVHKASKDHICSSCGKGFTQKQSLIRHERTHTGDKPYSCKLCAKSFSDYAVIRKHLLMSHKKDKLDWKDFVITEERRMSNHYIVGGPGYVRRERSDAIREKNQAIVIPSVLPGGKPVIIENKQAQPNRNSQSLINAGRSYLPNEIPATLHLIQIENTVTEGFEPISNIARSNNPINYNDDSSLNTIMPKSDTDRKHGSLPSPVQSSVSHLVNYNTLQNLANPAYILDGLGANQSGISEESVLSVLNSQLLAPLTGTNTTHLEQVSRGLALTNPSALNASTATPNNIRQSLVLSLGPVGQHGSSSGSSMPVSSSSEPVASNSATASAALSALGIPGYQSYFNTANFNQYQQQD